MVLSGGMIMSKIFMVYASQTGNTEIITDILEEQLNKQGHEVVVKSFDFDDIPMDALVDYDAVLIGTYTWDDGELPYEVEDFYIEMEDIDLTGHIIGVYGSADSFYDTYGGAIELVWDHAKHLGATLVDEPLKIDLEPNREDEARLAAFARLVSEKIAEKKGTVA